MYLFIHVYISLVTVYGWVTNHQDRYCLVLFLYSYSLSGGNAQFTINPSTGQIITSALLDRETKENYTLIITAKDGGSPRSLSSSTSVLVTLADVNDNPPKFQHHPYVTHIPSPTSSGNLMTLSSHYPRSLNSVMIIRDNKPRNCNHH